MLRPALALVLLVGCQAAPEASEGGGEVTLAAAASLRRVMPDLIAGWSTATPGSRARVSYGSSGTLRQQVEAGAPIDGVLFASSDPVDQLVAGGLVEPASRRVVASNQLVLIAPADSTASWTFQTLADLPAGERLALGEPATVPAGRYAQQALEGLGSWDALADRVVFGGDVAMVLAYAKRGEVAAAIVYATEALDIEGVRVLDRADWAGAPTPVVAVGTVREGAQREGAASFLDFVAGAGGQARMRERGFGPP